MLPLPRLTCVASAERTVQVSESFKIHLEWVAFGEDGWIQLCLFAVP